MFMALDRHGEARTGCSEKEGRRGEELSFRALFCFFKEEEVSTFLSKKKYSLTGKALRCVALASCGLAVFS